MNRKSAFVVLALILFAMPPAFAAEEIRYTLLLMGNKAGTAVTQVSGDRERRYSYEYNDRGRGPKVEELVKLDERGVPVLFELTGHDYWKNPVDERFELKDGKASWHNVSEKEEGVAVPGLAYFLTMNGAFQEGELLARLALASPSHTFDILPTGKARIEEAGSTQVEAGGKTRKVNLYSISGLGFSPYFIWLDENKTFFGADWGWTKIAPEGWESALPKLKEVQDAQQKKIEKEQAVRLARKPQGALAFRNARLFDPVSGKTTPGTTVVISGNRIQAVGPDAETQVPAGAEVIDAAGKTLMPGLWDMHAHLSALDGVFNLASGVTTARDLANDTDFLLDLRRRIETGEALGTRIVMAGFMDGPGPYAGPTKVLVDTEEEALAAVDNYAKLGYEQIKLYSSLDPKLVPAIVQRAHSKGMRVSGHIPNGMTAAQAVRAGFDEIQHVNFLFLNFLDGVDTRTPDRFHALGERWSEVDLGSERVRSFLALLKEKGTVSDPTLVAFEGMFADKKGVVSRTFEMVADRLPPQVQRGLKAGGFAPEGKEERYAQAWGAMKAMVKALHDQGIPIVAGTDNLAGFSLHRELELYVEAGIPPVDALRAATIVPAKVMKKDQDLGSVASGKLADVILIDGDPTADIRNVRKVVLTVKDGIVYDPVKLYAEIGVKPAK